MYYSKHFNLEEARSLIPVLKQKLVVIRNLFLILKSKGFDIYSGKYAIGFHPETLEEFPAEYKKIRNLIEDIHGIGIEIKGIETGLVDFPAIRENGEEVFLCWKMDEDDIEFWHSINEGFLGRHHIDEF